MQNRQLHRNKKKEDVKAEDLREEGLKLLVAVTAKMENVVYNKKEVATPEDFYALYADDSLSWLKDQVDTELGDDANFIKK